MGAFLDKPKTKKVTQNGEGCGIRYGVSAMQGWRIEMEDSHVCNTEFELKDHSFFGVFDGHAGPKTSKYCSEKLLKFIMGHKPDGEPDAIRKAIHKGFLELDEELKDKQDVDDRSGTTAVVVMITGDKIIWGNCGDSRGIVCRNGAVSFSTQDHKPYNPVEKDRIEKAGGTVMMQRVNGSLAVSRALGDFDYKRTANLPATSQLVSPEPDITVLDRDEENDSFLFLACDGIYDVMTNEEVVAYVLHRLELTTDLSKICSDLIDTCLNKNSRDNMSAVLVTFANAPKISQEAIEREEILQRETIEAIDRELKVMVEECTDQMDLDESSVMDRLSRTLPDQYNIFGKRMVIVEKLQVLRKEKFGDMADDYSGPSDPSEAPNEMQYSDSVPESDIFSPPEAEVPVGTSVDQRGEDSDKFEVGLQQDPACPKEKTPEVKT